MMNMLLKTTAATLALAGAMLAQTVVPDGTPIKLRLNEPLHSGKNKVGQGVNLTVADDVMVDGKVAVEAGARASGRIIVAEGKKSMGRGGKLDFSAEKVTLADGRMANLRQTEQGGKGNGTGVKTGLVTLGVALVFWPAAPVALLIKGKDVEIPAGSVFTTFTDGRMTLAEKEAAKPAAVATATATQPAREAVLELNSSMADADIEVDGRFVGQAPAKLNLSAGRHKVTVRAGDRMWQRTIDLNAGSTVNLNANFSVQALAATNHQ